MGKKKTSNKSRQFDAKRDLDPSKALDYLQHVIPSGEPSDFDEMTQQHPNRLFDKLSAEDQARIAAEWRKSLKERRDSGRSGGKKAGRQHPVTAGRERAKKRRGIDPRNPRKKKRKPRLISLKEAEEYWVEMSRKSPVHYYRYVFDLKPEKFHIEWMKQMLDPEHRKTLVVAPRGSAKTTVMLIMLSWMIGHYPELNHQIISVSLKQATDRLRFLRGIIEFNPRFRKVFPHIRLDKKLPNNATNISVKRIDMGYGPWRAQASRIGNGVSPTLFVSGVGGQGVTGSRVTGLLVLDDVCDAKNQRTEDLRDELWNWIVTTLLPVMSLPHASLSHIFPRVFHVTTRWHKEDVAQRQINSGEYTYSTTRALLRDENNRTISYWPKQYPLTRLMEFRNEQGGPAFGLMFLNAIGALEGDIFHIDMLRQELPEGLPPLKHVFITSDPAITAKTSSDDSVVCTIGVDYFYNFFLLELKHGKWRDQTTVSYMGNAHRFTVSFAY